MTITQNNLPSHELIGLKVQVARSSNPRQSGLNGVVRDESRNMIQVESGGRLLRLPKQGSLLVFELPDGTMASIEGLGVRFRPEDRIKRGLKSW